MPTYKYLNPNLVQRDDQTIAWNAADNVPLHPDELKIWKAAGAPAPEPESPSNEQHDFVPFIMPALERPGPPIAIAPYQGDLIHDATWSALDQVKINAEHANDIDSLKQQVAALADAVQSLLERPPNNNVPKAQP